MKNSNIRVTKNKQSLRIHNEKTDIVTSVCLETGKIHITHFYDSKIRIKTNSDYFGGFDLTNIECNGENLITIEDAIHKGNLN
tara:strand:+ start:491 stop:739 length:249 start_codon:yes stop_codon:yes gene_type:complete